MQGWAGVPDYTRRLTLHDPMLDLTHEPTLTAGSNHLAYWAERLIATRLGKKNQC